jgi:hypothetical protein
VKIPAILANFVIVLVCLVWAGNFVASLVLPEYRSDSSLNFVFMTIVGGALALRGDALPARLVAALRPAQPPEPPAPPAPEERP